MDDVYDEVLAADLSWFLETEYGPQCIEELIYVDISPKPVYRTESGIFSLIVKVGDDDNVMFNIESSSDEDEAGGKEGGEEGEEECDESGFSWSSSTLIEEQDQLSDIKMVFSKLVDDGKSHANELKLQSKLEDQDKSTDTVETSLNLSLDDMRSNKSSRSENDLYDENDEFCKLYNVNRLRRMNSYKTENWNNLLHLPRDSSCLDLLSSNKIPLQGAVNGDYDDEAVLRPSSRRRQLSTKRKLFGVIGTRLGA